MQVTKSGAHCIVRHGIMAPLYASNQVDLLLFNIVVF